MGKLLHGNIPAREDDEIPKMTNVWGIVVAATVSFFIWLAIILVVVLFCTDKSHAAEIPTIQANKIADAIYIIEGGRKTHHPYGVLGKWHKSPRTICINTIKHQYRNWAKSGRKMAFTAYLGHVYAPVGCNNDVGTNKYWISNLNWYIQKGI